MKIKTLVWVVSTSLLVFSSEAATAGPITSLYYLAGGELRSVGFDGTSFTSAFTSLETPVPEMSGISIFRTADLIAVVEPSALVLFIFGLASLGVVARRREAQQPASQS